MRVCLVYDCLYPYTVGGGERWYRSLAERLAQEGHEVTYLTLRQWKRTERPSAGEGVRVRAVGPRLALYTQSGRRRIFPPLAFGVGVFLHLIRHGRRYDVVDTGAFPYFALLAVALVRPLMRFALVVDWFEVWSRSYWREYLGPLGGHIGELVQLVCARVPQHAFCLSELHARRLRTLGLNGTVTVLRGLYAGAGSLAGASTPAPADPVVLFAARLIPEKRATLAVAAIAEAATRIPGLRGKLLGDGPERGQVQRAIAANSLEGIISAPGFVDAQTLDRHMRRALCVLVTSRREGYGLVVVEAAAKGTPSVVVADEDNAATELIVEGVNGIIARDAEPETIADAIQAVSERGMALRESTARWFNAEGSGLTLSASLDMVLESYARPRSARAQASA
jgi:glycosyltransferase involved in cell wall biosynthesis